MQIREIMNPDCKAVQAKDSIAHAAAIMRDQDIGMLPVLDAEGYVAGTVTDRDIVVRGLANGSKWDDPIEAVMTREVISCTLDDDVEDVAEVMKSNQIRRMLVTDEYQQLAGVVSLGDMATDHEARKVSNEVLSEVSRPH